jgi:hypothetical protein
VPFIVTTKRPCPSCVHGPAGGGEHRPESVSRRAVATLEEVQVLVSDAIYDAGQKTTRDALPAFEIQESGGTVGPITDGTLIAVEPLGRIEREQVAIRLGLSSRATDDEWCAAYNAAQGS